MRAMLAGTALLVAFAIPAAAQSTDSTTGAIATSITAAPIIAADATFAMPPDVTFLDDEPQAKPAGATTPTHQMAGKAVTLFVQGGLEHASGETGFFGGVEAAFTPMPDKQAFEVNADFDIGHASGGGVGATFLYIAFDGQYNVTMSNNKTVPFINAGIGITHYSAGVSGTSTNFQIGGGVSLAMASGREVRVGIRFIFTAFVTTVISAGFGF